MSQENLLTFDDLVLKNEETGADSAAADYVLRKQETTVNRSTYVDDATHVIDRRDMVQFYRTYAKRVGSSRGASKCAVKFTRDIEVPNAAGDGTIVLPLIGEMSFSIPLGANVNAVYNLREKMEALMANPATAMTRLLNLLEI